MQWTAFDRYRVTKDSSLRHTICVDGPNALPRYQVVISAPPPEAGSLHPRVPVFTSHSLAEVQEPLLEVQPAAYCPSTASGKAF